MIIIKNDLCRNKLFFYDYNIIMPYNLKILRSSTTDSSLQRPIGMLIDTDEVTGISLIYVAINHGYAIYVYDLLFTPIGQIIAIIDDDLTPESPTALVRNTGCNFIIRDAISGNMGVSRYIIVTSEGSVFGYNALVNLDKAIFILNQPNAEFTGIAINDKDGFIYVTDFANNIVYTYDGQFRDQSINFPFIDPNLPENYSCDNIVKCGDELFVSYSAQDTSILPLSGYINIFTLEGIFVRRFTSSIGLDQPYGMSCIGSVACFGRYKCKFLVGNNGSGLISGFDEDGKLYGFLKNMDGVQMEIENINCILPFGEKLYLSASPNADIGGQLGYIVYL